MPSRFRSILTALFGVRPRAIVLVLTPTILALGMDLLIRARQLVVYPPLESLNYFGSTLASAGFWAGPLWLSSRFFLVQGARTKILARIALVVTYVAFVFPFTVFCYGGQVLYHRVFHAYMARDTVRLGIALRGTLKDWLTAWGGPFIFVVLALLAIPITLAFAYAAKRAARDLATAKPILPILGFAVALFCFWIDFVESRSLQAAPPDTCFIHGVMHALRDGVTGKGWVRHGISLRTPKPLPPLVEATHRPNVIVILTESVRADAMCSAPPPKCVARFLDDVIPDRIPLGKLTTQSPGTFSASTILWTGMPPNADFATIHSAPVLWEIARASGYRTAYVTSQNLRYDDFGSFVQNAGIDAKISAMDLGDTKNAQIGAPDERATAAMLEFLRANQGEKQPYFAFLHFSNTHAEYRFDPELQPFQPTSDSQLDDLGYHNRYRNSVLLQERTLANFLREAKALPSWNDTVVLFLSDHGEQFREHGGLYHINSLFDEETRIPGFLVAGANALNQDQRNALRTYEARRTYSQDITETVVDLFGAFDARVSFPFAELATGRSLVRPAGAEQVVTLATETAVWEADDPKYGAMFGDFLLVESASLPWGCYDAQRDPGEQRRLPAERCPRVLVEGAKSAWSKIRLK